MEKGTVGVGGGVPVGVCPFGNVYNVTESVWPKKNLVQTLSDQRLKSSSARNLFNFFLYKIQEKFLVLFFLFNFHKEFYFESIKFFTS